MKSTKVYLSKICALTDILDIKLRGENDLVPEGVLVRFRGVHDSNVVGKGRELESEIGCGCGNSTL